MRKRIVHKVTNLDHYVTLEQTSLNRFAVVYGCQIKKDLTYEEAALEYGSCIMHSATCAGRILP